ncbi:MAG: endo-1,4-beta-xylanase [Chloroflexota bacterium]
MLPFGLHPLSLPRLAYLAGRGVRRFGPAVLRVIVLLAALLQLTPAPPRMLPYPPQAVETQHPVVCVHTRLTDEVEDLKIQRTLQLVREMGASTIVDFLPWAYIEGEKGQYDWHHPDRIINMARQEGIDVIVRLGLVPAWARPKPPAQETSLNYLTPDHFEDYAQFVGKFVEHYRGVVGKIIVWNEPNINMEWGYRASTPEEYVQMLKLVYAAAHEANPNIVILAGALAPTLEPEGSPNGLNDLAYLRRMYAAGAASYFDALAVHTYGFTDQPEAEPAPDRLNFRRFELLYAIMQENHDAAKPIYITESGWNDDPRWTKAVHSGQRVKYTLDSFKLIEQRWPTVKNLCIWYFRVPLPVLNYPDYFAFATTEFRLKPIYYAVQGYARGLAEQ